MSRHHVVIVGGGFGGLSAVRALRRGDVDVTLVDRTNHHLVQPLLYQLATGILSEGDIAAPLRHILRRQRNARVVVGDVIDVDLTGRRITVDALGERSEIGYDSVIIAAGARQSYFGQTAFAQDAPGMKTIDDALELRGRIFGAFEMAERETDPIARRRWLTFVVVGGGPTGVELAGQLAELSNGPLRRNFRRIDPAAARIVLIDAGPAILTSFPDPLRARATRQLEDMGVEIHVGTRVTAVAEQGIETNSIKSSVQRIDAATKIWAAGVEASPLGRLLAEAAGVALDAGGRVKVESDCTLSTHPEVFVVGDLMSLDRLPGVTQVAIQSGRHAAETILRRLSGDMTRRSFRYRNLGTMATVSRFRAVAVLGGRPVSGLPVWLLRLALYSSMLSGFTNRLSVLFNWTIAFLGRARPQRVITSQQVFARNALEGHASDSARRPATSPGA
jgi:NADH:ubiquinone reductase (H+-translocating)